MSLFDSYRATKRAPDPEEPSLTVAAVARAARSALEAMGDVWVRGEVAELTRSAAGHVYFTLADPSGEAAVRCVLFRSDAQRNGAALVRGAEVRVRCRPTLYEARGTFQLVASRVLEGGEGDLARQLEERRKRLAAEGLFDAGRKRPLPRFPRCVGIATSTSGAALHDVLRVAEGRAPCRFVIADCRVQGDGAAASIVAALAALALHPDVEVVIVGRGGGSAEDLAAFQDEAVVRAIAACRVPVVSAVGHETDHTLADLAADLRAATPSNAAELVVPDRRVLRSELDRALRALERAFDAGIDRRTLALERLARRIVHPRRQLAERAKHFEALVGRLPPAIRSRLAGESRALSEARGRLRALGPRATLTAEARLRSLAASLHALSPLAVLARGYAIVLDDRGRALTDASAAEVGSELQVRLANGSIEARITKTHGS